MGFKFPGFFRIWKPITTKEFLSDATRIVKMLSEKDIDEMDIEEYSLLTRLYERDALGLRFMLEKTAIDIENGMEFGLKKKVAKNLKRQDVFFDLPVRVSTFDINGAVGLHVMTAYTFKKESKYSFALSEYVHAKLTEIVNENGFFDEIECDKKLVYAIRVSKKFNPSLHCDNDNLELSKIINTIFSYLRISDNPMFADLYCGFLASDNEDLYGSHFIVVPKKIGLLTDEKVLEIAQNNILKSY